MTAILLVLAAYLMGSLPTSYLVARHVTGIDLRRWGSGNLGATNLYRAAGAACASIAVVVDIGKGFVPTWFFPQLDGLDLAPMALAYGAAAVIGHIFSVWVAFHGGKGVATGAGVYLALAPAATGLSLVVWLSLVIGVRIVSVASLAAATTLPGFIWLTGHGGDFVFWASLPLAALVWWTHRSNLRRLLSGREPRVARGQGSPTSAEASGSARPASEG